MKGSQVHRSRKSIRLTPHAHSYHRHEVLPCGSVTRGEGTRDEPLICAREQPAAVAFFSDEPAEKRPGSRVDRMILEVRLEDVVALFRRCQSIADRFELYLIVAI